MDDAHGGASDAAVPPNDERAISVYRAVFENAADAILVADDDGRYIDANAPATQLLDYTRDELLTMTIGDVVAAGPVWGSTEFAHFTETGTWRGELELRRKDGSLVPVESHASSLEVSGRRVHVAILRDITDRVTARTLQSDLLVREQEARRAAEAARQRLELVSEISELLALWTDYPAALKRLAALLVQRYADICVIDLVDEFGRVRRAAAVHADPAKQPLVDRLAQLIALDVESHPAVSAIRSQQPVRVERMEDSILADALQSEEAQELVRSLGYRSFISVPLVARRRVIGAISLVSTRPDHLFTQADVPAVEEIARRAAVRIDNARLYIERDEIARALQTALLPPRLPEVAGVRLAARYETADRSSVGGDFYDVIDLPDGTVLLVIGDVRGKGPEAAAVTGLARHTIRGVSIREQRPAHILTALNAVLVGDETSRFVTACCVRLDPATGEATICVAGHPAPLLVSSGDVRVVDSPTGLLLGEFDEVPLEEAHVTLGMGDAVVLYTDGLLGGGGDVESLVERLRAGGVPAQPGRLVEQVLASATVGPAAAARIDDVAILAALRAEG